MSSSQNQELDFVVDELPKSVDMEDLISSTDENQSNVGIHVKEDKYDEYADFSTMSITTEDADPFALQPKVEPESFIPYHHQNQDDESCQDFRFESVDIQGQNDKEEKTETATEHNNLDTSDRDSSADSKCMICNESSKSWPSKRMNQKQQLAECLCKLLGLPNLPYETDFFEAEYCSGCHKKILEVGQLFKSLDRLQNSILEMRIQLEDQISLSSLQVLELTTELMAELSEEQIRMQGIRKKIINKLGLSGSETLEQLQSEKETLPNNEPEIYEPLIIKSQILEEDPEAELCHDDAEWIPNSPVDIGPSDYNTDSDYDPQPPTTTSKRKQRLTTRQKSATFKMETDSMSETEPEKTSLKNHEKQKRKKILIVKLEQLTDDKLENVKISKTRSKKRQKTKESKKTKEKKMKIDNEEADNPFKCPICSRKFQNDIRVTAHVKRFHEGISNPYSCDYPNCTKSFRSLPDLNIHKLNHTKDSTELEFFVCDFCGKKCKTAILLNLHQKNKHSDGSSKGFQCQKCDRSFTTKQKLNSHDVSHTKAYPFMCEICGKGFVDSSHFNEHCLVKHGNNPFKCELENCGKSFCNKKTLEQHLYTHNKNWPFSCSICGVGSVSATAQTKHMRKHAEEKEFTCEVKNCNKKFRYPHSIQKHMMSHNGIKNFECEDCGKKFIDRYKLNRHKRLHTGDRPYQCNWNQCHKCFYTKDYLNIHIGYHKKAAEQGKRTINQAKIKRTLDTGVSGARGPTTTGRNRTSKLQSNLMEMNEEPNSGRELDAVVVNHHPATCEPSTTHFPVIVSSSSTTSAGEVFFQGEFYHIFP